MDENNNVVYEPVPVAPQKDFDPSGLNPWQRMNGLCSDSLFLAVCVLYSVNVGCAIFGWLSFSLPVIEILFTIFLWMAYAAAKKNRIFPKDVRRISGTVLALKIVRIVEAAFVVIVGFLLKGLMGFFASESFAKLFMKKKPEIQEYLRIAEPVFSLMGTVFLITMIVCAVIALVLAILGIGSIHKFVKTAYRSAETGTLEIKGRKGACGWLIAFGILYGISALSILFYVTGAVQYGTLCAAYIILSKLINKYYGDV
ncbi:MAG: hypothetical protein IK152_10605 [Lachnospiraceae bacterium]|nr:hypothetical protein [Lachnospiraceae bacterium]